MTPSEQLHTSELSNTMKASKCLLSFVFGKAKLAPSHATTIPCLELCAATVGIEITELIIQELDIKPDAVAYYSDSRVVLGYITNETRRFYDYVSNRVERISIFPPKSG